MCYTPGMSRKIPENVVTLTRLSRELGVPYETLMFWMKYRGLKGCASKEDGYWAFDLSRLESWLREARWLNLPDRPDRQESLLFKLRRLKSGLRKDTAASSLRKDTATSKTSS